MDLIYAVCVNRQMPMIIHAGREPKSPSYACDPYVLCRWEKVAEILETYPELRLCIPHLGMDEFESYNALAWRYDNLWLDTAVALTDYLPLNNPVPLASMRRDRIMYGSDFPNIPYAWDRELKWLCRADLDRDFLERILWKNAAGFFNIQGS
jgi:predicted TIM-barrel fold metal-dependent hydrolase